MSERKKRRFSITREQLAAFEAADADLEFKPLTEATAEDFKKVVRARFPPGVERQVDTLLANPLRKYCDSVGDIAYEKGEPACVQGAMLRRVYYKQTPYLMLNGSMFAKMPNASPVSVFGIMCRTDTPRGGLKLSFTNTAVPASCEISGALVLSYVSVNGPCSWSGQRVATIRPMRAFWSRFRTKRPVRFLLSRLCGAPELPDFPWPDWDSPVSPYSRKSSGGRQVVRCVKIDDAVFEPFWNRLIESNRGLLASRSPEDLRWMFGSRLLEGRVVMLTLSECDIMVGYIVFCCRDSAGKSWTVIDMVAEDNDSARLTILMREAVRFLRRQTPAMEFCVSGFPTWVQPIIAKVFKRYVAFGHNYSSFFLYDEKLQDLLPLVDSSVGWFCGPVDGDVWL